MKLKRVFTLSSILIITACQGSTTYSKTPTTATASSQPTRKVTPTEWVVPEDQENDKGEESNLKTIVVPSGNPPNIDGTQSPGEWDEAATKTFADGSKLLLTQSGGYLYLGIRANELGMIAGNVFIHSGNEITILHTSAALGTAIYKKSEDSWQQTQDFTWRCLNTGNSEAARTERIEFLQDEGWLAANGRMGTPNELEYQIRIPDQDFQLAAVYIKATHPYQKVLWPAHLDDDCIKPTPGGLPLEMQFSPDKWMILDLSNAKGNV